MTDTELCRLCAESKTKVIGIYDDEGQKLEIERKIAKCLDIQVVISDILPLSICTDCCALLTQYEMFYMKTHQAQLSLRQLFIDIKPIPDNSDPSGIESVEKTMKYLSKSENVTYEEEEEEEEEDQDHDYAGDNDLHTIYISEDHDINEIDESDLKLSDIMSDDKSSKKSPLRQKKKQIKRRLPRKTKNLSLSGSDNDDGKIPENYMTGTESDRELIESKKSDCEKVNKSRGKILDRYPWLCTDCNDKLSSLESLEHHHNVVHNQQAKYMCVQCCKVYEKYNGFLTHVKRHKNNSKYNCDDCGKSFVHKKVLDSHKAIHSDDRPHVCVTCGKSFRQQSALYIHSRCHLPEQMKNRYPCEQCGKRFSTKPNLVTHKRIHSGVRNFTCDQCGKSFIQKGNLEAHFLTHSADKPYSCSLCTKAFKTPLQLKKHETVHTGAKPHQCAVCGRTFREKGTLREHHRIHTGAMPFTCEFCGKCFRFKGILTTHRRQHTGERPYSCIECQHHFTNWPNYNKHMKRRHGINTSHTKHLQQSVQELANQEDDHGGQGPDVTPGVQIIQTAPESSPQEIVIEPVTATSIQTFQAEDTATIQNTFIREKNGNYFNSVSSSLQTFLTPSVPYNFYNVSSTGENESVAPK